MRNFIETIRESLKETLRQGDRAFLFGSRARGDYRDSSDWDILIIRDTECLRTEDYDDITYPLYEIGWDNDETVNPVMYSSKDWERQSFTPFYKNVTQDAIPLL